MPLTAYRPSLARHPPDSVNVKIDNAQTSRTKRFAIIHIEARCPGLSIRFVRPRWARQPCTRASIIRGTTWDPKNVASDLAPPWDNIRLMMEQNERVAETRNNDQSCQ